MQVDAAVLAEIGLLYLRNKNLEAQLEAANKHIKELMPNQVMSENLGRGTAIKTKEMEDRTGTPAPGNCCQ